MSCINNTNFTQGSCVAVSGLMSLYTWWSVSRGATCILTQSSSQYVSRVSSQYVSRVTPLHHKSRPSMRRDYSHLERWLVGLLAANTCQYSSSRAHTFSSSLVHCYTFKFNMLQLHVHWSVYSALTLSFISPVRGPKQKINSRTRPVTQYPGSSCRGMSLCRAAPSKSPELCSACSGSYIW